MIAVVCSAWGVLGWIALGLAVLAAVFLAIPPVRRACVTGPLLSAIRPALPTMSPTEREALEAGTTWWDAQLFTGRPDWHRLLDLAPRPLSTDEKTYLDEAANAVCAATDDWACRQTLRDLPPEVWAELKRNGTYGLRIAATHGGKGFSARAFSDAMVKYASRSVALSVTGILPNSLGPGELLERYGTDAQKAHWLPRLATGREEPAFGLTEPTAGSDATGMRAAGVVERARDGSLQMRLDWDKRYITMSARATVLGLAFKLRDPGRLLGGDEHLGITVALVPTSATGVTTGARHDPLGVPFVNGTTQGRDVVVPIDAIIGGPAMAGKGWRMLMDCLAAGRGIGLPSLATGMAKAAARAAGAYAAVRQQFKLPIGRFEGIQEPLARIAAFTWLMDATRQLTVAAIDAGEQPAVCTAIAKYQTTELGRRVVNDAMDIQAGAGIVRGPRNSLAGFYEAAPIGITVEGANILTRALIVFGQGAMRGHPWARAALEAATDPDRAQRRRRFDRAVVRWACFSAGAAARASWRGLTRNVLAPSVVAGPVERDWRVLGRLTAAFAHVADASMLMLQGRLKRMEMISGRLADALGWLYVTAAGLWRFERDGRPPELVPVARWAAAYGCHQVAEALRGVVQNLPNRFLAFGLRWTAFPTGYGAPLPGDRLTQQVAETLLVPGPARDRLTAGMYLPDDPSEPIGRLDRAQRLAVAADEVHRRLRAAQKEDRLDGALRGEALVAAAVAAKLVTKDEAQALAEAEAARADAIEVDAFGPEHWTPPPARTRAGPRKRAPKRR